VLPAGYEISAVRIPEHVVRANHAVVPGRRSRALVERVHEFCGRDAVGVLCAAGLQEALNGPKGSIPRLDQSGREVRRELGHIAKVKGFRSPTSGSYDRVSRAADDVEVVI
jgi:hypothetical protein